MWTDRPQAGSVHETGGLKLLIDRRTNSKDNGGIPQSMTLDFDTNLVLNFRLLPQRANQVSKSQTLRKRGILAVSSNEYSLGAASKHIGLYAEMHNDLLALLKQSNVDMLALTRLTSELIYEQAGFLQKDIESAKIRVRLDLSSADKNMLQPKDIQDVRVLD